MKMFECLTRCLRRSFMMSLVSCSIFSFHSSKNSPLQPHLVLPDHTSVTMVAGQTVATVTTRRSGAARIKTLGGASPQHTAARGATLQGAVTPEPDLESEPWSSSAGDGRERRGSLLSPSSTSSSSFSSSFKPGPRDGDPRCREFLSGSMLITEKATSCSTPAPVGRGNRGPTTRSWRARRNGGIKRSIPGRGRRPRPQRRAQLRIPPPWRHRGTSPAGDAEAVVIGCVQELAQDPASLSRLGGVAVSDALVGLVGQGVATGVLLMGRGIQGGFGVWGVRQGALAVACAHTVGGQIPLVGWQGRGRATLLIKHRC
ncbi:hypothetical protein EYF80_004023 [Liparis tanakae]|uniref:Uncharacterized protein n=1 Tax=Liparis tanakae TaxID=230148 RepID=A0A4Z2J6H0_9TELE|nr:hypothetical protein EYF80_004023 [Liparis tanakae]